MRFDFTENRNAFFMSGNLTKKSGFVYSLFNLIRGSRLPKAVRRVVNTIV